MIERGEGLLSGGGEGGDYRGSREEVCVCEVRPRGYGEGAAGIL